jgi:TonB family protein
MRMRRWFILMMVAGSAGWCFAARAEAVPSCASLRNQYKLPPVGGTAKHPSGAVVIEFELQPSGTLVFAKVMCPSGSLKLDSAALKVVKQNHFRPFSGKQPKLFALPIKVLPYQQPAHK